MAWLKGLVTRSVKWAIRWLKYLHADCRREILGLIIVKELALLDLEAGTRVSDVKMRPLPMLRADTAMCAIFFTCPPCLDTPLKALRCPLSSRPYCTF